MFVAEGSRARSAFGGVALLDHRAGVVHDVLLDERGARRTVKVGEVGVDLHASSKGVVVGSRATG